MMQAATSVRQLPPHALHVQHGLSLNGGQGLAIHALAGAPASSSITHARALAVSPASSAEGFTLQVLSILLTREKS